MTKNLLTPKKTSTQIGQLTENIAEKYLLEQGLCLVSKNFHSRQGEIDLIMRDGDVWVFVEVKYRKNNLFGGAINAISAAKQRKIKHSVAFFLHKQQLNEYNTPCRFDFIAIEGHIDRPNITWLKNAF